MFDYWWHTVGSGIVPLPGHDHEEHAKHIAKLAYDAALDHAISECELLVSRGGNALQCADTIRDMKGEY